MRVCGYCSWRELCLPRCAVLCFFARSSDWLRFVSLSSFRCLRGGGDCGRSFRNRRKKLRQLRANLIWPDKGLNPRAGGAAMEEIADWLEKLGMSEYTQCFTEHKIDVSVLHADVQEDIDLARQLARGWHRSLPASSLRTAARA